MAALGLAAALAPAQERVMPKGMALRKGGGGNGPIVIQLASESPAALELARDSEAELWLKKAQAAADRSDWKLAIDTLWRVVDQYPIGFVSLDGTDRASTTGACWTLLHRWGADALSAYRTVYEPEAQRLFTEARAAGDSAAMRRIVRRYFPTQAAADALDWLATVELDSGRADEAAARLRRLLERSQPPATARRLHARLAVASALAGRGDEARRELAAVRDSTSAPAEDGDANPLSDELLSEIEKLVARRAAPAGSGAEPALWSGPASLGGGRDRLVAIEPTLSAESPWWLRFDGTAAVDNLELAHECETAPRAPVWQAGADERQLWIRAPGGVVALDAATFDVRWRADIEPRSAATARVARVFGIPQGGRGPGASSDGLTATAWRSVWDDLAGTISVASGLVFAVETPRELELGPVVFHPALGLRQAQRPPPLTDDLNENSLYAFDAQTGKLRWVKGADGPAGDGLAAAHFFAPPVLVNDWLVAPLALGDEFCLAVMNSDGRLVGQRTIRLGTTNHGVFAARAAVQPVVAGGSLLVPTGCGVVISLSTDDFALQWAASYPRLPILASGGRAVISAAGDARGGAPGWASNPPLAAGPVWIIAAPDSDELLALDRVSGAVRWRVPRGEQRFVLGADDRAVFLSGVAIEARSLDDGSALWTREKSGACGRALLVGDRILVPTAGALLTLATGDGHERSSDPLPNPVRPLGNLFSWRDSLYSLTACGVERIADVPRSLAAAKHDAAVEPRSAHALLRLAVLESLQGRLSQAAELLDRARALAGGDASDGISDSINHLWIDTQLSLARGDSPKRRAERVAGACRAAQRPGDRLRAELARLDTLLEAEGRPAAVRAALALAARIGSDVVAPEELLITRAGVLIAERLVRISAELSDEERGALRQAAVQMAESLDAAARMRLADTLRPADLSAALDLRIATDALAAREVESAEAFFMHAAECATEPSPCRRWRRW
ncbi:MAG: PQQ-binding-like beta-propeller repeat protein [Phycisphaerae bacterium]